MGPADTAVELGGGDYITYPADIRHLYEALAPGTTAIMPIEVSSDVPAVGGAFQITGGFRRANPSCRR